MKLCLGEGDQSEAENRDGRYGTAANRCSELMWRSCIELRATSGPGDPWLPTTGATHLGTGADDGSLAGSTDRPGSGHGAATGSTSRPRRSPADLRIIYWNAGGISGRLPDLRTLVQSQDIHIVLLGETKLRPRQQLRLPTFVPPETRYRPRDRFSGHRGTGAQRHRPRRTGAAGVHHTRSIGTPTILAGDLNAKHTAWGSRVISPAGRQLLQDSEQHGYEVRTTHHHTSRLTFRFADVLDVVLCHQLPYPIYVEVLYDMDTQHLPILITLGTTAHMTPARPPTHRTDWDAFKVRWGTPHR
ncbi:Probable RNA-directed DNA polymerase from transposon BS [Eumeta japonica]|uniref:Probable RNA-directed DNA polymerase from transposon BS n=1 Tax=Eumeta variegata TaxID=151549 RepID=A0A4C1WAV0_EUMVA|nr:Probable RNA-directed DNA polymerase from transposon BS [Eumeta japonica]